MRKRIILIVALILVTFLTGNAHAVIFSGTAFGEWNNVNSAYSSDVYTIDNMDIGGVAYLNWGETGVPGATDFDNQFTFNGIGSDGGSTWTAETEDPFLIGDFEYRNGSTTNSAGNEWGGPYYLDGSCKPPCRQ